MDDKERLVEMMRRDAEAYADQGYTSFARALTVYASELESLAGGEAVAWRVRVRFPSGVGPWCYHEAPESEVRDAFTGPNYEIEAVYAHPAPAAQPKDHSGEQRTVFEQATAIANSELTTLHEVIAAKQPAQAEGAEMERAARVLTAMADGHNVLWEDGLVNSREHYNSLLRLAASALRRQGQVTDEMVRGAVARGWCTRENEHKTMDPVLAEAIVVEVCAAISARGKA